jgi:phage shock protein C
MKEPQLVRSESDKMVAGVCGGLAAYLGLDPTLVRLAFVLLLFASGIGFPIYLVLWVIMPRGATAGESEAVVMQDNIKEMKETVSAGANRLGQPVTVGIILIMLGFYFLFSQLGWMGWMGWMGHLVWPLLIIGVGVWLLRRK